MAGIRREVVAATSFVILASFTGIAYADSAWLKGSTDEKLNALADIQPGVGTVMIEYSYRFTNTYYAAKGGNWDLADYMIKEMREIQEVGETTRPARAQPLKAFESAYLDPLAAAIKAKDSKKFETVFNAATLGCNGCHAGAGFPFIKYQRLAAPLAPLSFKVAAPAKP